MNKKTPITIAYGDGIGPEIMQATLNILTAAHAPIETTTIEVGKNVYLQGFTSGIPEQAWDVLKHSKILLKGPITTPQGGGYKSLNVTLRKTMGLYANVRPCVTYKPYVPAHCDHMDLVIVRENEEDTYSGIEYRQTEDLRTCIKVITRPGCEKIIRYAFDYARRFNRKKVTCFSKDNIMKMTDGLFHQVFNEIAQEYPDINTDHYIVDIGTALLATQPERFDVIVTLNLYGDIISDVAAQVAGSVGLAGSANIGEHMAMFEAIHGSAPDIAGKDIANPSGLLNAAIQMLVHIGAAESATLIQNAWLKTLEDGIHTGDIYSPAHSKEKVGTKAFAEAVIARLGQQPTQFKAATYQSAVENTKSSDHPISCYLAKKTLVGIDICIDNVTLLTASQIAEKLLSLNTSLHLLSISSRGLKTWPNCPADAPYMRQCVCRFISSKNLDQLTPIAHADILALLAQVESAGFDFYRTENLYLFDGERGFSLAQGQ